MKTKKIFNRKICSVIVAFILICSISMTAFAATRNYEFQYKPGGLGKAVYNAGEIPAASSGTVSFTVAGNSNCNYDLEVITPSGSVLSNPVCGDGTKMTVNLKGWNKGQVQFVLRPHSGSSSGQTVTCKVTFEYVER